jgi:hypothetical protein
MRSFVIISITLTSILFIGTFRSNFPCVYSISYMSSANTIPYMTSTNIDYSQFRCIHLEGQRSCFFHNVCLMTSSNTTNFYDWNIQYFENPSTLPEPLLDGRGIWTKFSHTFVSIRKNSGEEESKWLPINVVRDTIPKNSSWFSAPVAAIFCPFYPDNFGHALGDDVFPIFVDFSDFNILDLLENTQPIMVGAKCSSKELQTDKLCNMHRICGVEGCVHLNEMFAEITPNYPLITIPTSPICFKKLVVGNRGNFDARGTDWWRFITFLEKNIEKTSQLWTPTTSRVAVMVKTGRRAPINLTETVEFLKTTFPNVPIDLISIDGLSFRQQIILAHNYTVLITPSGGISFFNSFLPTGASVIFIDFWNSVAKQMGQMEEHLWAHDYRHRTFHYQMNESEVVIPKDAPSEATERSRYRNYGRVVLNPYRMGHYLWYALQSSRYWMNLQDGFIDTPEFLGNNEKYPPWLMVDDNLTPPLLQ